jgi:hypothetical protein
VETVKESTLSAKLVKEIDDFVASLTNWTELCVDIHDTYEKIKGYALEEGISEFVLKDILNAKVKPLLSNRKYYKLLSYLFRPDKPELEDKSDSDDDDDSDSDSDTQTETDQIEFPHRLLNRLTNIINERKGNGLMATFLKVKDNRVTNILEE